MKMYALGLIETVGYTTAVSAADAALKAANVTLIALEKVIGVGGSLGVTIHLNGDVGAVQSAVEAGKKEAERVGKLISAHVIPRAHSDVDQKLLRQFSFLEKEPKSIDKEAQRKKQDKEEILTEQKVNKETKTKNANNRAKKNSKEVTKEKQTKEDSSKKNSSKEYDSKEISSKEENANDGLIIEDQSSEQMNPETQEN